MKKADLLKLIAILAFMATSACKESGLDTLLGVETVDESPSTVGNSALETTPAGFDFGNVQANSGVSTQVFKVKNIAEQTVFLDTIGSVTSTHFTITSHDCPISPSSFAPGSTCDVTVKFQPLLSGSLSFPLKFLYGSSSGKSNLFALSDVRGTGVGPLNFGGIKSISDISAGSMKLNWDDANSEINYQVFEVTGGSTLTLVATVAKDSTSYTVTGLSSNSTHTYRVRATDALGQTELNTIDITKTTLNDPQLTTVGHYTFGSTNGKLNIGQTVNIDINDVGHSNDDTGMTYTCDFDQVIDNSVSAGANCTSIPGFTLDGSFSTNGQFSFTPTAAAVGAWEVEITGSFGGVEDTEVIVFNVPLNYSTTNLLADFEALFARSQTFSSTNVFGPPSTSPLTSSWKQLLGSLSSAVGSLITPLTGWTQGWQGNGTTSNPYRLSFDGTDDRVNFSNTIPTSIESSDRFFFDTWIRTSNAAQEDKHILGYAAPTSGFRIEHPMGNPGFISMSIGAESTYADVVAGLTPQAYYKMDDTTSTLTATTGPNGTYSGTYYQSQPGSPVAVGSSSEGKSVYFHGNNGAKVNMTISSTASFTMTAWFKWGEQVTSTGYRGILASDNFASGSGINAQASTGNIRFYYGGGTDFTDFSVGANDQRWHFVALVRSGNTMNFYYDGQLLGTASKSGNVSNNNEFYIGRDDNSNSSFSGYIDEVATFAYDLTTANIQALYNAGAKCMSRYPVVADEWTHVAGSWDGTSNTMKLFVNGFEDCSRTTTKELTGGNQDLLMGARTDASKAWVGETTEMRFYSTGGSTEIKALNDVTSERHGEVKGKYRYLQDNLKYHYRADKLAVVADGTDVTTWSNSVAKSPQGTSLDITAPSAGEAPHYHANQANGYPILRFDGVNDRLTMGGTQKVRQHFERGFTVVAVLKSTGDRTHPYFIHYGEENSRAIGFSYDLNSAGVITCTGDGGADNRTAGTHSNTGFAVYSSVIDFGNTQKVWVNGGTELFSTNITLPDFDRVRHQNPANGSRGPFTVGRISENSNQSSRNFKGDMAEIMMFDRNLSNTERQEVECYLGEKYGITVSGC